VYRVTCARRHSTCYYRIVELLVGSCRSCWSGGSVFQYWVGHVLEFLSPEDQEIRRSGDVEPQEGKSNEGMVRLKSFAITLLPSIIHFSDLEVKYFISWGVKIIVLAYCKSHLHITQSLQKDWVAQTFLIPMIRPLLLTVLHLVPFSH
jgi:hypothetical protein